MVDDNRADLMTVERYLRTGSDHEVVFSGIQDPDEALDEALSRSIDLIILDYQLPSGNGFDLLERLRSNGFEGPVVMLTGRGDESVAARAVKRSLAGYLPKDTLSPEDLCQCLEPLISETVTQTENGREQPDRVLEPESINRSSLPSLYGKLSRRLTAQTPLEMLFVRTNSELRKTFVHSESSMLDYLESALGGTERKALPVHRIKVGMAAMDLFEIPAPDENHEAVARELLEELEHYHGVSGFHQLPLRTIFVRDTGSFVDPSRLINRIIDNLEDLEASSEKQLASFPSEVNRNEAAT
ncbi:MAG: response regulator [bacterium]